MRAHKVGAGGASLSGAILLGVTLLAPQLAWAAEEGGHGFSLKVHGFYLINFILFAVVLVLVAGPAIRRAIRERAERTSARLTAAREEARRAGDEVTQARGKVAGMEAEKSELLQRMQAEGTTLAGKIQLRAAEEAAKIKGGAEVALAGEKARLEKQLMREMAMDALAKAEMQLKNTWQSLPHERFIADFGEALRQVPSSGRAGQETQR